MVFNSILQIKFMIFVISIITITITTTIDFTFKLNLYFFDSNNIYFKFNNMNEFNNIYNINKNIKLVWSQVFIVFNIFK
jgi:hypothetical protein